MTKKKTIFLATITMAGAALLLTGCASNSNSSAKSTPKQTTIYYSAAASLQNALTEIDKNYEKTTPDVKINFDFAGSGAIREKVLAGAPIDGVFLASKSDTDKLTSAGKATDAQAVLGNTLVLITNKKSDLTEKSTLQDTLAQAGKIAVGEPATVPAGMYAEQSLTKLNDWNTLKSKFVMGSDVTQVLSYVASGNADLGFVYKTDAMSNDNVKVLSTVPNNLHDAITYYTATVSETKHSKQVEAFDNYLKTPAAQKVFEKYGFASAETK